MSPVPELRRTQVGLAALLALLALNLGPAPGCPACALVPALAWAAAVLRGRQGLRLALALAYAALTGAALAWLGDPGRGLALSLRVATGAAAGMAFSAMATESALRETLRRLGLPTFLMDLVDDALLHGRLLGRTLSRRLDASRIRLGGLPGTALALAGGLERAFTRGEALESARSLREAPTGDLPAAGTPTLQVTGLAVRHPEGGGLEDLDLTVAPGEWIAILGPSGSGKSTLLRCAAGLLRPSSGTLLRHGLDGAGRLDGRTALVFQDPEDQLLAATPLEDAAWGLERRDILPAEARQRAAAALDTLGLHHRHHHPLHKLSHGERKRAAFASALVTAPDLLLLDEPTAGLDPLAARRLVHLLESTAPGAAVLWATHDLQNLPSRIRRVLLLREGRTLLIASREEALERGNLDLAGLA